MNVDAAINANTPVVGICAFIWNSHEEAKTTFSQKIIGFFLSKIAKAKALDLSLTWAKNVGLNLYFVSQMH